jgi:prophage DNA circulation protein
LAIKLKQGQEIIKNDLKEVKSIQDNVKEFIISTEKAIEVYEQDHSFIEKLKKAVG